MIEKVHLGKLTFQLDKEFVSSYALRKPPFGFNGLGELTYIRTYSRLKENGENEKWHETVERVVNGVYSMQKNFIQGYNLGWNEAKGQVSAKEMYDRIFNMKFLPPGRGLWAMGSRVTTKGVFAALNNCAFVSTENIDEEPTKPFEFLMDMSMLGVGVGFDVEGAGKITLHQPAPIEETFIVPDSREGWVTSVKRILESYFLPNQTAVKFDYSQIRPAGSPIRTFGGVSAGPAPLIRLHQQLKNKFEGRGGDKITVTDIVDIQNMIGCCVVSGNVRRSAELSLGPDTKEYLSLKDYKWNGKEYEGSMKHRSEYGWASNNSINAKIGQDYSLCGDQTGLNGEPGYLILENMQKYGRMIDPPNNKDHRAKGSNPCVEQTLESFELCCLVETFPNNCTDKADFLRTLKFAYLYAKTVTLGFTHWEESNRVMMRNRRIGTSMSGIVQIINKIGIDSFRSWCDEGYKEIQKYDEIYADWFCIPKSIKTTSIKPSGTVSLLAGATPGIHHPEDNYYIRRIRLSKMSKLLPNILNAGYVVEEDVVDSSSMVVEIPVALEGIRRLDEVSIWEQIELATFMQRYWADNQVSCTVTFQPELLAEEQQELEILRRRQHIEHKEELDRYAYLVRKEARAEGKEIKHILNLYQYQLKGISFLPKMEMGKTMYAQVPYEPITKEIYLERTKNLNPISFNDAGEDSTPEMYCTNDNCMVV